MGARDVSPRGDGLIHHVPCVDLALEMGHDIRDMVLQSREEQLRRSVGAVIVDKYPVWGLTMPDEGVTADRFGDGRFGGRWKGDLAELIVYNDKLYLTLNPEVNELFKQDLDGNISKAAKTWPGLVEKNGA